MSEVVSKTSAESACTTTARSWLLSRLRDSGVLHDYADVLALGVDAVLGMYGLDAVAVSDDLTQALLETGAQAQTREIERLVARQHGATELLAVGSCSASAGVGA